MARGDNPADITIELGSLWTQAVRAYVRALRAGALQPMVTVSYMHEHQGVNYLVRLARPDRKSEAARRDAAAGRDPFLPYDAALHVADISPTHVCLLNKFNVIKHHLIIATRAFAAQEELLDERDFAAAWTCLVEVEGLVFYNSGPRAGASQEHKHFQAVPLPLDEDLPRLPLESWIKSSRPPGEIHTAAGLPFAHALVRIDPAWTSSPERAAGETVQRYRAALDAVHLVASPGAAPQPYNLLLTRDWMLIVPRSRERAGAMSINALGFAGSFLARSATDVQELARRGPLAVLTDVAVARDRGQ